MFKVWRISNIHNSTNHKLLKNIRNMTYKGFISPEKVVAPVNRNPKSLDRDSFTSSFDVWTVLFPEVAQMGKFVKQFKKDTVQINRLPFLFKLTESEHNLTQLPQNPQFKAIALNYKIQAFEDIDRILSPPALEFIKENGGQFYKHRFELGYDFWKPEEILQSVLPENLLSEAPSSFTKTGHIAHLNLRDEYKPYDNIIGQVILDKNPCIKTVVDKMQSIDTQFRTFQMRVIAGENNLQVEHREGGCVFNFDFSKVYWNSRLSTEHSRLVNLFKADEAICDVMAGVGPFAIPQAKKNSIVFANDLNPEGYKYLTSNVKKNKVEKFVTCFNKDGRQLIKESPRLLLDYARREDHIEVMTVNHKGAKKHRIDKINIPYFFSHYIMNLPDSAMTFVNSYIGLYTNFEPELSKDEVKQLAGYKLPTIHVHHFEKFSSTEQPAPSDEELKHRAHLKVVSQLEYDIPYEDLSFHYVRLVAPTKPMFCISFTLPEEVAFRKKQT